MARGFGALISSGQAVGINSGDYVQLTAQTLTDWLTFEFVIQIRDSATYLLGIRNTTNATILQISLGSTTIDTTGRPCIVMTTSFTTQSLTTQLPFDLTPTRNGGSETVTDMHHFLICHKIDLTANVLSFGWHNGEQMASGFGQGAVGTPNAAGDYAVNNTFPSYLGNNELLNNAVNGVVDRFRVFQGKLTDDVALSWSRERNLHSHDDLLIYDYEFSADDTGSGYDLAAIGGPVLFTFGGGKTQRIEGRTAERGGYFESASRGFAARVRRGNNRRAYSN